MASRQEEKQRRREERLASEREAASAAQRRRRLQIGAGAALALAAIVAVIVAVAGGGGGGGGGSESTKPNGHTAAGVGIPKPRITDLTQAARAAACELHNYPDFGHSHTTAHVTYKTNPPTSGDHNPTPAPDGIYDPGKAPAAGNYVHSLEHGRIEIQYRPGTPTSQVKQLEALFNEPLKGQAGYKQLLFENNTGMPFAVAATAWTHLLGCHQFSAGIFDAIRTFRQKYVDAAPELIPFPE